MTDVLREQLQLALGTGYTLERELGGGGMSRVFVARDVALHRDVVVKVLHPDLAAGLSAERFTREIQLAASLQQANIVPLLSAGATDGLPYYTMPFVKGRSLRERLARDGTVPITEAISIVRDVARALSYAHAEGVVHRDIKPENILLSGDAAVVTDFGIAKALAASKTQAPGGTLTKTGTSIGTPAYMAPEQAAGDSATDHRADLYALGCVAYELLSGAAPFADRAPRQLLAAHMSEVPAPLAATRPDVPPALAQLVARCLEKDPDARPQTARAVLTALDAATGPSAPTASGVSVVRAPRRRALLAGATVALVAALGLVGWVLRTRASTPAAATTSANAAPALTADGIAVLPFESLGDSADAYFADGITDAVRGRLMQLSGVRVIARASVQQYRGTSKTPAQIARELGVRYLLTGTVRWDKVPAGGTGAAARSRVQVSPELVEVTPDGAAQGRWQQSFDAELRDVFRMQGEIAGRAVDGMHVALGSTDRARVEAVPVAADAAGYDLYLRGVAAIDGGANSSTPALRRALGYFEQAVARDTSVAEWWASLAMTAAHLYGGTPDPALAERARAAAARTRALDPTGAPGHLAMGAYHRLVKRDNVRALTEYEAATRAAPGDAVAAAAVAIAQRAVGQFEPALAAFRRAAVLDPRSPVAHLNVAATLIWLRRYDEARASAARFLALTPSNLTAVQVRVLTDLARGDLAGARRVLADAAGDVAPAALAADMAFADLGWSLDDSGQRLALSLGPDAFDGDRAQWGIVRAQLHHWRGDTAQARVWADTARVHFAQQLRAAPSNATLHGLHGLALAYLGRRVEAAAEAERIVALMPVAQDAFVDPYVDHLRARIYQLGGEREKALNALERVLSVPYWVSGASLRIDPTFAPLRGHPRFERLTAGR